MFFLLRLAFWLGVVCILLPSGGNKQTAPATQISATQAVTLASAAVTDMRGFCDRQPDACKVGGKVAVALGHRAEAGALTLIEFVTDRMGEKSTPKPVPVQNAAARTTTASIVPVSGRGHGTLTASDLVPAWHVTVPLPPRREARAGRPSV
jgi:Family of unknown function (DUF5330)